MITRYQADRDAYVCDRTQRRLEREGLRLCVGRNTAYRPGPRTSYDIFQDIIAEGMVGVYRVLRSFVRAARQIDAAVWGDDKQSRWVTYGCGFVVVAIAVTLILVQVFRGGPVP